MSHKTRVRSDLGNAAITDAACDGQGTLWMATESGLLQGGGAAVPFDDGWQGQWFAGMRNVPML